MTLIKLLILILVMLCASTDNAQTDVFLNRNSSPTKPCIIKDYVWTGVVSNHPNFMLFISGGSSPSLINISNNWSESSYEPSCTPPEQALCFIRIIACGPLPSKQNIINAVEAKLLELLYHPTPQTFTNNYTFFAFYNASLTIYTKLNPD